MSLLASLISNQESSVVYRRYLPLLIVSALFHLRRKTISLLLVLLFARAYGCAGHLFQPRQIPIPSSPPLLVVPP